VNTPSVAGPLQPAKWGKDHLTEYLAAAHQNRLATFANKREAVARLIAIDACYATAVAGWRNPKPEISALLFIRTLGSFRASCEAAMAGAVAETFIMIRAMLEAAGYAAHIGRNPRLAETWLRRHDPDPAAAKAAKDAFTVAAVRKSIQAVDRSAASRFHRLYNEAIDFGAHPNERGITGNMTDTAIADGVSLELNLLQGDGTQLDYALISTARAGLLSLDILGIVFGARFELLGLKQCMLALRQGI